MPPVASPINWQTLRDAIYDAANGATGWTTTWAEQDAPQPAYPYLSLRVVSGPTKLSEHDEHQQSYDGGQPLGQEVGHTTGGMRELVVSVQAFQRRAGMSTSAAPEDALTRLQAALGMATYRAALRTDGLVVVEVGPVTNISTVVDDSWSARAAMEVRFRTSAGATERGGYIAEVEVDPTYTTHGGAAVRPTLDASFVVG